MNKEQSNSMNLLFVGYPEALESANFPEDPILLEKKHEGMREASEHLLISYNNNLVDAALAVANAPGIYFNAFKIVLETVVQEKLDSIPKIKLKNSRYIGFLTNPSTLKVLHLPVLDEEEKKEFLSKLRSKGIHNLT